MTSLTNPKSITTTNLHTMFHHTSRVLVAVTCLGFAACAPHIDMPKGTSKGYTSARLVQRDPNQAANTNATEIKVHHMIQKSLANQFTAKGIAYGKGSADLSIAYLVIYQEPGMTSRYEDYFGYGRDANQIADVAHTRGVINNQRPDYFQRAGIVIDVIDTHSNKLVYRNYSTGDVVRSVSDSTRAGRIDAAISQALAPFFGKN